MRKYWIQAGIPADKIYTDTSLFNLREAVNMLSSFQAHKKGASFIVKNGLFLSNAVKSHDGGKKAEMIDTEANSHDLSSAVMGGKWCAQEDLNLRPND